MFKITVTTKDGNRVYNNSFENKESYEKAKKALLELAKLNEKETFHFKFEEDEKVNELDESIEWSDYKVEFESLSEADCKKLLKFAKDNISSESKIKLFKDEKEIDENVHPVEFFTFNTTAGETAANKPYWAYNKKDSVVIEEAIEANKLFNLCESFKKNGKIEEADLIDLNINPKYFK